MKHTIDDVALAAGVSKATVSRVLNGTAKVSKETQDKVLEIVKKLNYQPNINARKLAGGSGGSIALVLEESTQEFFGNPFWRQVVDGFISEVSSRHQHPVLYFHSKDESDRDLVNALVRGNYDAVAIFGWHRAISSLEKYIPENIRVVFGGRHAGSKRFTYVGADNFVGGEMATGHLIERGCKNIIMLTGDLTVESGRERLAGYKSALTKAGLPIHKAQILECDYSRSSADKAMSKLLNRNQKFDGIFAGNDLMAMSAIQALIERGVEVPNQVKVIGFDGVDQAAVHKPPISTIAQPSFELGSRVARQLTKPRFERLENIELELELIARKSTSN